MRNMSLAGIKHNNKIAEQLISLNRSGRLVHAFLFYGGTQETRSEIGREFAKALLCGKDGDSCGSCVSCRSFESGNNADFLTVSQEEGKASIGVSAIAELQKKLMLKSVGGKYVVLFTNAELMTAAAQNKLLKTLEEPAGETVMILLSERRDAMLDTVLSRCSVYALEEPEEHPDPQLDAAGSRLLQLFKDDAPYYRKKECIAFILDNKESAREQALQFLDSFEDAAASEATQNASGAGIIAAELAETARRQIKMGQSIPYTLKQMCLGMKARR